jgi:hypothetical protein
LSCHGAGRGGVRQLCTVDPCHCMAWFSSSFGVVTVHAGVGGVSEGTSRGNDWEGALQGRETSSSPASACAGEEEAQYRSKRYCFVLSFFFLIYYLLLLFFFYFLFSCVVTQKWVTTIITNGPCPKTSQPLIASSIIFYGKSNIVITLFQRTWPLSLGEQCFFFQKVVVFVN